MDKKKFQAARSGFTPSKQQGHNYRSNWYGQYNAKGTTKPLSYFDTKKV